MDEYLASVSQTLARVDMKELLKVLLLLKLTRKEYGRVLIAGNGGSAATASHAANDFTKMGRLTTICLNDMVPTMLAYGNDNGWRNMFAHPMIRHWKEKDLLIGISCSGNSENVVRMAKICPSPSKFVLFTGMGGGECEQYSDIVIRVSHKDIRVQEDVHLALFHALAGKLQ